MRKSSPWIRTLAALLSGVSLASAQTYTNAFPGLSFTRPIWMEEIPGKPGNLLVLEQVGSVQLVRKQGDAWTKTEFVKIPVTGGTSGGDEQGLLGFAFHPQFAQNRKYYLYYVHNSGGLGDIIDERLADETLLKDAGAAPRRILRIEDNAVNHNGGTIRFRKDGFLYFGIGDGGSQNDPNGNGQNKNALLAKMLRIDVDKSEGGKAYGIPADNPFAGGGGAPEVWAWGLRNPYRWVFDPVTDEQWVADVGQITMEEVDIVEKNSNYGWKVSEGTNGVTGDIKAPVFAYGRTDGTAIVGGYVFRGNPASRFNAHFVVGDYGTSNMWALKSNGPAAPATKVALAKAPAEPRGFGTDHAGRIYLMAGTSTVYLMGGPDWEVAAANFIPEDGRLKQGIGCIFACRPGARLDAKAFAAGSDLSLHDLSGARLGTVSRASGEVPSHLKAGMYILKTEGRARPDLLMIK
jgi:glucose/arabinose dehydrogenase